MSDLTGFPITRRFPPARPDAIQLYSLPTPNGVKISIMLEETGLAYEPHAIDILKGDQNLPEFVALNPNAKIPAMIDPNGPGGKPLGLFESGAMLVYLAEKTGKFLSPIPRAATRRWPGCSSRWAASGRCSVRWASSTNSPGATMKTSGRFTATATKPAGFWACSRRG